MSELQKLQQTPPASLGDVVRNLNLVQEGHINSVGSMTLSNNGTTTVLTDTHIVPGCRIGWKPTTANAATVTGMYADKASIPVTGNFYGGQITFHHSAVAASDLIFDYWIFV